MMLGAGLTATPLAALATSGTAPGEAGLVSGLINTSRTMGGSLGLAVMSTIAAARTASVVRSGGGTPDALTEGYALAFRTGTGVLLGGVVLMAVWLPWGKGDKEAGVPSGMSSGMPSVARAGAEPTVAAEGAASTSSEK
jgi:hypothetical protein